MYPSTSTSLLAAGFVSHCYMPNQTHLECRVNTCFRLTREANALLVSKSAELSRDLDKKVASQGRTQGLSSLFCLVSLTVVVAAENCLSGVLFLSC